MMSKETGSEGAKAPRWLAARYRRQPIALLVVGGLVAASLSPMAWAKWSGTTGAINGHEPTATGGTASVMFPNGTTAVTNNVVVGTAMKPTDFVVLASGLILQDQDGDTGLSAAVDKASVIWVWKYNNVALTAAQLAAPFSTNFLGQTLTVAASAPVMVSSLTGVPTTGSSSTVSSATYSVKVPHYMPVVRINNYSVSLTSGVPAIGFIGAKFQYWMNGTDATGNGFYTFVADPQAPWVTVDPDTGVVTFTAEATMRSSVTISMRLRGGNGTSGYIHRFSMARWVKNSGTATAQSAQTSGCSNTPGWEFAGPGILATNGQGYRGDGTLSGTWGPVASYIGGIEPYPTSGWQASGRYYGSSTQVTTGSGTGMQWLYFMASSGSYTQSDAVQNEEGLPYACIKVLPLS